MEKIRIFAWEINEKNQVFWHFPLQKMYFFI